MELAKRPVLEKSTGTKKKSLGVSSLKQIAKQSFSSGQFSRLQKLIQNRISRGHLTRVQEINL